MEQIIEALYRLAERQEVSLADLASALDVAVYDDGLVQPDSVADLAATIEGSLSHG